MSFKQIPEDNESADEEASFNEILHKGLKVHSVIEKAYEHNYRVYSSLAVSSEKNMLDARRKKEQYQL